MTSVTSLPSTLLSPPQNQPPSGQSLALPASGAALTLQGASAPSFEELMARMEAVSGSPSVTKPTFAFSELGMFGLSGAVAFPNMAAASTHQPAPAVEPSPQLAGLTAEAPASAPEAEAPGTAPPGTSRALALNSPTSPAVESAPAGPSLPQFAVTAGALAPEGVQAAATADEADGMQSLASVFKAVTNLGGLEPMSASKTPAETAPMEAPGPGSAPFEFATPSQRQATAQTDANPNADLNLVVSERDGEAQVTVAAPALSPEVETRLRQVADAVAADFGLTLTDFTLNGAAVGRASTKTGAQNAGRFTY